MGDSRPTRKELYEMIREQIRHEDCLINNRLGWLLASQGFLFVAYNSTWDRDSIGLKSLILPSFIGLLAFSLTLASALGIVSAFKSLKQLRETWTNPDLPTAEGQRAIRGFPPITWVGRGFVHGRITAFGIPTLIMLTWIFLINFALYNTGLLAIGLAGALIGLAIIIGIWRIEV